MTDRRNFLRGMVALSAAAVPVVTQAATLDPWDRLAAGLTIIAPNAPKAVAHAKAAGMKPEWIFTIVTTNPTRPVLLFERPDGQILSFGPQDVAAKGVQI